MQELITLTSKYAEFKETSMWVYKMEQLGGNIRDGQKKECQSQWTLMTLGCSDRQSICRLVTKAEREAEKLSIGDHCQVENESEMKWHHL